MPAEQRRRGVVTASTGNHGQAVALAGRLHGSPVTVFGPREVDAGKLAAMRELGARVELVEGSLQDAARAAGELGRSQGLAYVEDGEDPDVMLGASSLLAEMLEAEPDLDAVLVPVGGGNLVASVLLAAWALKPGLEVVGVQSTAAPGATLSWLRGEPVAAPARTIAGGLATEHPGALALDVMNALLERMALVDDDHLRAGVALAFRTTALGIEPAAAAGLAALELFGDRIPGERLGVILTGGWISGADLCAALAGEGFGEPRN
jgi:threonine dehydratase